MWHSEAFSGTHSSAEKTPFIEAYWTLANTNSWTCEKTTAWHKTFNDITSNIPDRDSDISPHHHDHGILITVCNHTGEISTWRQSPEIASLNAITHTKMLQILDIDFMGHGGVTSYSVLIYKWDYCACPDFHDSKLLRLTACPPVQKNKIFGMAFHIYSIWLRAETKYHNGFAPLYIIGISFKSLWQCFNKISLSDQFSQQGVCTVKGLAITRPHSMRNVSHQWYCFFLAHCELILRGLDVDVQILVVQIYHPIGDPRLYQNLAPANSLTRTSKFCGNIALFFHHSMQPRHREPKAVISTFPCSSSALKHNPFANLHCFLSSLYSINIQSNCFMQNRRHCFRFTPCMFIIVSSGFGQWNPPSVPFRCDDLHGWTSPKARSMQDIQVNVGMGLFFMVCHYVWLLEYLEM